MVQNLFYVMKLNRILRVQFAARLESLDPSV